MFSIFLDSKHEKSCVSEDVFPALRSHCKSLGMQFHAVDFYSAVPLPPPRDRETMAADEEESGQSIEDGVIHHLERKGIFKLATEEIKKCQTLSAGPNFIVSITTHKSFLKLHQASLAIDFVGSKIWLQAPTHSYLSGRL